MNRPTIIILCAGILLVAGATFTLWPHSHRSLSITDVSHPFSASVSSFKLLPASGALYVIVEGQLDGTATLEVASNHGRDHRELSLSGEHISLVTGGAEAWVDDLQVQYRPLTAKRGQLYVSLYCGTGFTPDDYARYLRIERDRH